MIKYSAAMLVCRDNILLENALNSVSQQKPDNFKAYIDTVTLKDTSLAAATLTEHDAEIFYQTYDTHLKDHHENVVHNVHRALLESEHKWCSWADDDDEWLGDRRKIIEKHAADDVCVIYGDVLAIFPNKTNVRRARQIYDPTEVNQIIGSGVIYNTDAFKEIHVKVDHGYFWDFKIFYWMMRAGYKPKYVPRLMSIQNVNTKVSKERKQARKIGWDGVVKFLDSIQH